MAISGKAKAEELGDSDGLKALARVGLVAYGVVYLLIGWLALQLAWGGRSKSPDPSGAFRTLAEQPLGNVLVWLVAVSLVALGLWKASEMVWGHRNLEGAKRVRERITSGFWTLIYTGLGVRSALVAAGFGGASSNSQQQATVGGCAGVARRTDDRRRDRAHHHRRRLGRDNQGNTRIVQRGDRYLVPVLRGPEGRLASRSSRIHHERHGSRDGGWSAQLCRVDFRLAEGSGAGRGVADGP